MPSRSICGAGTLAALGITLLLALDVTNNGQNSAASADERYITCCAMRHTPCQKITWLSLNWHVWARGVPDAGAMVLYLRASPLYFLLGAQRLALPAWGGRVDSPSKRESAEAKKMPKKRGAYPKSGARCVRRFFAQQSPSPIEFYLCSHPAKLTDKIG